MKFVSIYIVHVLRRLRYNTIYPQSYDLTIDEIQEYIPVNE